MATLAENIANLEAALARGTREVSIDGRKVVYNGPAEIREAIAYFRAQERAAAGQKAVGVSVGGFWRD